MRNELIYKTFKERKIPIYLQQLFAKMLFLEVDSLDTLDLTESFGWTDNEVVVHMIMLVLHMIMLVSHMLMLVVLIIMFVTHYCGC